MSSSWHGGLIRALSSLGASLKTPTVFACSVYQDTYYIFFKLEEVPQKKIIPL